MSVVTYLDGSQMSSTALTNLQVQTAIKIATSQSLGLIVFSVNFLFTSGSSIATPDSLANLSVGQIITCASVPVGTTVLSIGSTTVTMSSPATASIYQSAVIGSSSAYNLIRTGWQTMGQAGPSSSSDTIFIRCEPVDNDFSRVRDSTSSTAGNTVTNIDVFTRTWRTHWTFYGPDSLDQSRMVKSALIKVPAIAALLAQSNLYVNPSIEEPRRVPENFQGTWWERVDMIAEFNEQITETLTVGTVGSVEVVGYTVNGKFIDIIA